MLPELQRAVLQKLEDVYRCSQWGTDEKMPKAHHQLSSKMRKKSNSDCKDRRTEYFILFERHIAGTSPLPVLPFILYDDLVISLVLDSVHFERALIGWGPTTWMWLKENNVSVQWCNLKPHKCNHIMCWNGRATGIFEMNSIQNCAPSAGAAAVRSLYWLISVVYCCLKFGKWTISSAKFILYHLYCASYDAKSACSLAVFCCSPEHVMN